MRTASSVFSPSLLLTTLGTLSLMFLAAFEQLAVATIMPEVADELDGQRLYSLALAAPMCTAIVGMVGSGAWSDRRGPRGPFWAGGAFFTAGLLVSGLSSDMIVFTVGRVLQGLGAGTISVTIYVLVARLYPQSLHPKIFGLFAACWVLPALVGPFLAGVIANVWSWHWVFLGVVALVAGAASIMIPSLRRLSDEERPGAEALAGMRPVGPDLLRAGCIALAVLIIGFSGHIPGWGVAILAVLTGAVLLLIRPLLPPGAFALALGLPAVIVLKGLLAAADFGAEAYLPLLFNKVYGLDLTLSGLALTAAAVTWAFASWAQGRFMAEWHDRPLLTLAIGIVVCSLGGLALATAALAPVWVLIACWGVGGLGMGLAYPRMSTMVIRLSTRDNQGFNSAALNMADSTGSALGIAALGVMQRGAELGPLIAIFAVATAVGLGAFAVTRRVGGGGGPEAVVDR